MGEKMTMTVDYEKLEKDFQYALWEQGFCIGSCISLAKRFRKIAEKRNKSITIKNIQKDVVKKCVEKNYLTRK